MPPAGGRAVSQTPLKVSFYVPLVAGRPDILRELGLNFRILVLPSPLPGRPAQFAGGAGGGLS